MWPLAQVRQDCPAVTAIPVVQLKPAHQTSSLRLAASKLTCLKMSSSQGGTEPHTPSFTSRATQLQPHAFLPEPLLKVPCEPYPPLLLRTSDCFITGSPELQTWLKWVLFGGWCVRSGAWRRIRDYQMQQWCRSCIGHSQHFTTEETNAQFDFRVISYPRVPGTWGFPGVQDFQCSNGRRLGQTRMCWPLYSFSGQVRLELGLARTPRLLGTTQKPQRRNNSKHTFTWLSWTKAGSPAQSAGVNLDAT